MLVFNIADPHYSMKMQILESLRTVIDPELHINIIDMGLVYEIKPDTIHHMITIKMTLSTRFCPMGDSIVSGTKNCLERFFPDFTTAVELVWEPEWNYDLISEEGLSLLKGI